MPSQVKMVFLSSTYKDCAAYREKVTEASVYRGRESFSYVHLTRPPASRGIPRLNMNRRRKE